MNPGKIELYPLTWKLFTQANSTGDTRCGCSDRKGRKVAKEIYTLDFFVENHWYSNDCWKTFIPLSRLNIEAGMLSQSGSKVQTGCLCTLPTGPVELGQQLV